ncbi:helix-turn-helix domain protein [Kribbella flavida DSM 17836]|uniref:Helix-turn-helix domain protein n=1 Tax=Kribbella flavida (strain DSM 17836 / JCM 10339 / NBRC 14399) TaxID=479435 RepID=D2PZ23_KRIFD|nr:helix-turn-helix transcriptional regulator [Kribbella flavida]ADB31817.1 helix-turn-helix domain protein [Kribbella flavida DSM 17836]
MATTPLGDYLRSRRALVSPKSVGLASTGRRRVDGLRREEVSMLAGVSVDYYVRLEQGRERNPSVQVLDALSAALRLDDDGRLHLFRLAGMAPRPRTATVTDRVDPNLLQLLAAWPDNPALVSNRAYDVLASNAIADALFGGYTTGNLMLLVFLDAGARQFYADWEAVAANSVAGFRLGHGEAPDDPRVRAVLQQLLEQSEEFAQLWQRQDARGKTLDTKRFVHPAVGELTLRMQAFDVRSAPGQELIVYHAEPGSSSAEAVRLLGTLAATEAQEKASS